MKILSLLVATTLVIASLVEGLPQPILDAENDWVTDVEAPADFKLYARAAKPSTTAVDVPTPTWSFTSVPTALRSAVTSKPPKASTTQPTAVTSKPPKASTTQPTAVTSKPPKASTTQPIA
ncbi:hypothetical protein BGZ96_007414, partial [Linnemannia gamsii]